MVEVDRMLPLIKLSVILSVIRVQCRSSVVHKLFLSKIFQEDGEAKRSIEREKVVLHTNSERQSAGSEEQRARVKRQTEVQIKDRHSARTTVRKGKFFQLH
ncbi:hypothetical protein AMECASPLE_016858, partial [Ameca splendens]